MRFSRRSMLKGVAAAAVAPVILKAHDALASSGQVNVYAWGDYIQENMIKKFEGDTGITVNLSTYGSNDEAENKLRAAGGKGFDVIFPSITNGPNYYQYDLIAPLDESKVAMDRLIPSMVRDSINLGATYRGKRYLLPFDWGTEAITYDSEAMPMDAEAVSFGSLWAPEASGSAAFRQKSVIMGVALYLDATGEVPSNRALDIYKSEDEARRVWDACAAFIIERKDNIAAFWNNATEATAAFTDAGATIGQTWDTTGLLLNRENAKWKYRMPKEGGITWMDSMGVTAGAENIDQAYAFINAMLEPRMAGMFSKNTGYNSAVKGAADHAGTEYKQQFDEVYNEENLANLWWWQADTPYFAQLRQEYVEKITNA
ncbi:extracellular solute-binding protein [Marivibrio halodurans]|uniref:Extracellular solute-binding protein n=1 Tax=Marivibrio halodurans TaxID=2039722 RepID=A0A8J7SL84_9PROT|nr:extracellular solute-binding protein [Marivibrio halodurans]MBP5856041.1 extracellular solute-binding protein [Marivibrio halodurans]